MGRGPASSLPSAQLHDQVVGADIVELTDIGVIQSGDRASFALEAFTKFGLGDFDSEDAVQACVAHASDRG